MNAPSADVHIASLVLQCRPEHGEQVAREAARLPGIEIAAAEGGKLVVLVEATSERSVLEITDALRDQPQVLDCQLVYHHHEPADALAEPVEPATQGVQP
ncbi:MAG TPA: chaperone NapD [Xanthomonadaceae bacterium]|nr:chaperone NapD [Xanthomonadaceae bacterium]